MRPARARSLLFFVLLFAVAALALEASYARDSGVGVDRHQPPMPQGQQQTTTPPVRDQGGSGMPADQ